MNLLYALIGVILGTAVGVLPGIGPAMTVALLLPVTYVLEPTSAFIMFAGIYYGGMYGGSTTSILLNTPGESSSVITAIEGNKMAKAGRAAAGPGDGGHRLLRGRHHRHRAAGGLRTHRGPVRRQPRLPQLLRHHDAGPAGRHRRPGLLPAARLCLAGPRPGIGLVGMDSVTGQRRLTFGQPLLADGLDIVVVAVPSSPSVRPCGSRRTCAAPRCRSSRSAGPGWASEDWKRSWKPWLRGTAFGFPFGALPAGGAEIPTFLSYVTEKRLSQAPGGVRQGRHRRRRRARGRQQRRRSRHPDPDARPGSADQRHGRRHAGRVHPVRHPAGTAAVREGTRWSGR